MPESPEFNQEKITPQDANMEIDQTDPRIKVATKILIDVIKKVKESTENSVSTTENTWMIAFKSNLQAIPGVLTLLTKSDKMTAQEEQTFQSKIDALNNRVNTFSLIYSTKDKVPPEDIKDVFYDEIKNIAKELLEYTL